MLKAQIENHALLVLYRQKAEGNSDAGYDLKSIPEVIGPAHARAYIEALRAHGLAGATYQRIRTPYDFAQRVEACFTSHTVDCPRFGFTDAAC